MCLFVSVCVGFCECVAFTCTSARRARARGREKAESKLFHNFPQRDRKQARRISIHPSRPSSCHTCHTLDDAGVYTLSVSLSAVCSIVNQIWHAVFCVTLLSHVSAALPRACALVQCLHYVNVFGIGLEVAAVQRPELWASGIAWYAWYGRSSRSGRNFVPVQVEWGRFAVWCCCCCGCLPVVMLPVVVVVVVGRIV